MPRVTRHNLHALYYCITQMSFFIIASFFFFKDRERFELRNTTFEGRAREFIFIRQLFFFSFPIYLIKIENARKRSAED